MLDPEEIAEGLIKILTISFGLVAIVCLIVGIILGLLF